MDNNTDSTHSEPGQTRPAAPIQEHPADPQQAQHDTPVQNQTLNAAPATTSTPPGKKKNIPAFMVIILIIIALIAGIGVGVIYYQHQLQKMQETKTQKQTSTVLPALPQVIVIGLDATAPPMESIAKNGKLIGYDIDLSNKIANELGVKVEIKNIPWANVFNALLNKKVDMIVSSVTITADREKQYDFSVPYVDDGQVIISRINNPISTVAGLKGKIISVQTDTTNEDEAKKLVPQKMILGFAGYDDAAKAVLNGKADAMISDLVLAKGIVSQYKTLKITSDPLDQEKYGIVFRKDETGLRDKVNKVLNDLELKGILMDLNNKWFE